MKLKNILKNIDSMSYIKILMYHKYSIDENSEEELYCGICWDCPWTLVEMYLDTDSDGEAIFPEIILNEKNETIPYISIYIKETKDE